MKATLKEISQLISGKLVGDENFVVEGIAPIEKCSPKHVTYISDLSKKRKLLSQSKAGCIILADSAKSEKLDYKGNIIYVDNPQWAFVTILRKMALEKKPKLGWGIHKTAVVDPTAKIGKYTYIGPNVVIEKGAEIGSFTHVHAQSYIGRNVKIGNNCVINPRVVIYDECVLRDKVIVHSGSVIGADGFGYVNIKGKHEKVPQIGRVVIEEEVEIGALTSIDRATLGETVIGAGTKIDNLVQIAHNVDIGKNCIIVSQAGVAGSSQLEDGVILAGQVGVVDHIKIGKGAVVIAQSGVMSDVKPGTVAFGSPARPHREFLKLQAIMSKLPEIYSFFKQVKKEQKGK
jgi:UDP-3-O-[3-hydroxymyristoyl] glucosamine N-acyltransferase